MIGARDTIEDHGDAHRYFASIPNLIDDFDLSPQAYRLYGHCKRVAGANGGSCKQSARLMATKCNMSAAAITNAKHELERAGLITIRPFKTPSGPGDEIRLVDIWSENMACYSSKSGTSDERIQLAKDAIRATAPALKASVHLLNACQEEPPSVHLINTSVHQINASPPASVHESSVKRSPIERTRKTIKKNDDEKPDEKNAAAVVGNRYVGELQRLGLTPKQAIEAIRYVPDFDDDDLAACTQFIARSTARKPQAVLWSQYLQLGQVPPSTPVPASVVEHTPDDLRGGIPMAPWLVALMQSARQEAS